MRRVARWVVRIGAALVIAAPAGAIYEEVGRARDRTRLPQVGRSIDIGGRALNISCSGDASPSVVLVSGAGRPGYAWTPIQSSIAAFARACWFDRAGEGWSDPGPFPRTSGATAKDLHTLLERAGERPPFVLVGHSLGGLDVRVFNGLYPNDVAGMVLVESAHEGEPERAPRMFLGPTVPRYLRRPLDLVFRAAARLGIIRLTTRSARLADDPAHRTREQVVDVLRWRPDAIAAYSSGGVVSPESYAEAHTSAGLGDRPLIVLTRGTPFGHDPDPEVERQLTTYYDVWVHELQAQLARLSTRGRQVIVERSGHGIPDEAPGAVIDAVREIVTLVRR